MAALAHHHSTCEVPYHGKAPSTDTCLVSEIWKAALHQSWPSSDELSEDIEQSFQESFEEARWHSEAFLR